MSILRQLVLASRKQLCLSELRRNSPRDITGSMNLLTFATLT